MTKILRVPKLETDWFHAHAHSAFSINDAITPVAEMPRLAKAYGMKAVALTDHGNMGGAVQFYKAAKEHGVAPFIGVEAYFMPSFVKEKAVKRWHVTLLATTTHGYENLVKLVSWSFTRNRFHHKPHLTLEDFINFDTTGIVLLTGCWFGWVQQGLTFADHIALDRVYEYASCGFDQVYVEVQHHNIKDETHDDDEVVKALKWVADTGGFPIMVTQDSHYAYPSDKEAHETLKRLGSWAADVDSVVFPGDSFHFAKAEWVEAHFQSAGLRDVWEKGLHSSKALVASNTLSIPALDTYHYRVPQITPNPDVELRQLCTAALGHRGVDSDVRYMERLKEELDVVTFTRMSSYLLLCREVVKWCEANDVYVQARGSASGSLVCYLLGVTAIDPIEFDLRYERFLSKDRTKPPDVDLDVSDERRQELIDWLGHRFHVTHIGTYLTHSVNNEGKGSLLVAYKQLKRKSGEQDVDARFQTTADLPEEDRLQLDRLDMVSPRKAVGTHAAGLVVTTDRASFERTVPTMLIPSSDTTVTQFDGDDCEAVGLVKLDILGLRNLSLAERCLRLIGKDTRDWSWMNMNDPAVYSMIAKGNTEGVFQLEGYANMLGCKEMKVRDLFDIIVTTAIYRPATLETGVKDTYIRRRNAHEPVPPMHMLLERVLQSTYGVPVFQDQVITILRSLGFSPDELTEFLKAVKASNKNVKEAARVVAKYKKTYEEKADRIGFSTGDKRWVWEAIEGFSEYGFNKSHASQYGLTAYRMAYLKFHYPLEFATALLQTSAGTPKESKYLLTVRKMGIKLLRPDVNISGDNWTLDKNAGAVRKGLRSIHGVGEKAAKSIAASQPFSDLEDLIARTDSRAVNGGKDYESTRQLKGVLLKLYDAGALASLGKG